MTKALAVFALTHLTAAAVGYHMAPSNEILDHTVRQSGAFNVDADQVLSATVLSLRNENKLMVRTFLGEADVTVGRSAFWILHGSRQLKVRASVPYYLDLSELTDDRVHYDKIAKLVTVRLPELELGDVSFFAENASETVSGVLTYNQETVDDLSRQAYRLARKTFVAQSQQASLVQAAQREAETNVRSYFEIPLRAVGRSDIKVVVTFKSDG